MGQKVASKKIAQHRITNDCFTFLGASTVRSCCKETGPWVVANDAKSTQDEPELAVMLAFAWHSDFSDV